MLPLLRLLLLLQLAFALVACAMGSYRRRCRQCWAVLQQRQRPQQQLQQQGIYALCIDFPFQVVKACYGPALTTSLAPPSSSSSSSTACFCSYWLLVEDASWVGGGVAVVSISGLLLQHLACCGDNALQQGEWLRLRNVSFFRQDLNDRNGGLLAALGWTSPDRAQVPYTKP